MPLGSVEQSCLPQSLPWTPFLTLTFQKSPVFTLSGQMHKVRTRTKMRLLNVLSRGLPPCPGRLWGLLSWGHGRATEQERGLARSRGLVQNHWVPLPSLRAQGRRADAARLLGRHQPAPAPDPSCIAVPEAKPHSCPCSRWGHRNRAPRGARGHISGHTQM